MKRIATGLALLLAAFAAYLLLWPTGMTPVAWTPPSPPPLAGEYEPNDRLKGIQRLLLDVGEGPEAVSVNANGQVYVGYRDGRIVAMSPDGGTWHEVVNTGGRPLGIAFGPRGGLVVADAEKGLLHVGKNLTELVTTTEDVPFGLTDDVDGARYDSHLYFTDASSKFGLRDALKDFLEHGANGRLLQYKFDTKQTRVLMRGLHFANGVAVGPEDAYVLVSETAAYRIWRYWLKGPKTGTAEIFRDNLPGLPDNITFNGRDRFWVALYGPRDAGLEKLLSGEPWLRHLAARLPGFMQPRPKRHSFVLAFDVNGQVVANLQYTATDAYAPITSVREFGPWLYFGSLSYPAVGRMPLDQAIAGAPPPPHGWEQVPEPRQIGKPMSRKEKMKKRLRDMGLLGD